MEYAASAKTFAQQSSISPWPDSGSLFELLSGLF